MTVSNDLMDEAREMARDALGDQADDEVLLQEIAEQIYESLAQASAMPRLGLNDVEA